MVIGNALNLNFSPNQLIYSPTDYELAGLSTLNNGVLVTSSLGVPSISNTLPIAVQNNITNLGTIASIGAPLGSSFGGTGVNNGGSTLTLGGSLTTSGAFASTFTMTGITTVTFPTSGTLATTSQLPTGAALTRTNDTNVTVTLGGTPLTALLQATSLTMGWTGQLGLTRGGTAASLVADNGGIIYSTSSALAILASTATANQLVMSGSSSAPTWSTATYPPTTTINQLLYSSSANTVAGLSTANNGVLITSSGGVPSISSTLPSGITLVAPVLGTPASGTLTNCTGLPIAGISGLGTGVATALAANVTGSGGIVLATSPTLVTPALGTPSSGNLINCTNGGSWIYITSQTASASAALIFQNNFSSSYYIYMFQFEDVVFASSDVSFYAEMGTGGTPTWISSGYQFYGYSSVAGTVTGQNNTSTAQMTISATTIHTGKFTGYAYLYGTNSVTLTGARLLSNLVYNHSTGNAYDIMISSQGAAASAFTAIQFFASSGNITSGKISMYGLANS